MSFLSLLFLLSFDLPQCAILQMLTLYKSLSFASFLHFTEISPSQNSQLLIVYISNTAKEKIMAGLFLYTFCVLPLSFLIFLVVVGLFTLYIHPRYTHTPLYFLLDLACLENT